MADYYGVTLGLTATYNAIYLALNLAQGENFTDDPVFKTALLSVTRTEVDDAFDIYGNNIQHLKYGVRLIENQIIHKTEKFSVDINQYMILLYKHTSKLLKNKQLSKELAKRIDNINWWLNQYDILYDKIIDIMASIYTDIISPLGAKITIPLDAKYINDSKLHAKIRACLLAAVRAIVLFIQSGGNLFVLLISKNKIQKQLNSIKLY